MNHLDIYIEETLIPAHTKGKRRKPNQEYRSLYRKAESLRKKGARQEASILRRKYQQLPSSDMQDPDFRRLRYVRYADDILLGFVGPKSEAEEIKHTLGIFLQKELKLELSTEKTLITHAGTEKARFLGYEIQTLQSTSRRDTRKRRSINGRVGLTVPNKVIEEKRRRYMHKGEARCRLEMLNDSDFTIIAHYQSEYRGLVEYYRMAYNLSKSLSKVKEIMEKSLTKTLAAKHKMSVAKVYRRYRTIISKDGKQYKGLQVVIEREEKKPLVAQWGGIPLIWNIPTNITDPVSIWSNRTELEKRLLANACEYCGAIENIEVHHIRALKDLEKYAGRSKPEWVKTMAARKRKTLVLCRACHQDLHAGHPMRRQTSSS